jgi:hypothetical protein
MHPEPKQVAANQMSFAANPGFVSSNPMLTQTGGTSVTNNRSTLCEQMELLSHLKSQRTLTPAVLQGAEKRLSKEIMKQLQHEGVLSMEEIESAVV